MLIHCLQTFTNVETIQLNFSLSFQIHVGYIKLTSINELFEKNMKLMQY